MKHSRLEQVKSSVLALLGFGNQAASESSAAGTAQADWFGAFKRQYLTVDYGRIQIHNDLQRMDAEDEIASFAHDTIADRTLGYDDPTVNGFTVVAQAAPNATVADEQLAQVQQITDDLIERCDLRPKAWDIVRDCVQYGNDFEAIAYDSTPDGSLVRIAGLKQRPEHTMYLNKAENGDIIPGYTQRLPNAPSTEPNATFDEHQCIHFKFGKTREGYGTGLFYSARRNWRRLSLAEDATAAARLMRAFVKFVHYIPVGTNDPPEKKREAVRQYKEYTTEKAIFNTETSALENKNWPTNVATDWYTWEDGQKRARIEMLDPANAQLANMNDVKYFLDRLLVAAKVPRRYYPIEGGTAKLSEGGGTSEDVNFACVVLRAQMMLQTGYQKLLAIELFLHGFDPKDFRFVFRMATPNNTDALRGAQTDLAKVKTMSELVKVYPGLRDEYGVMLKEYTQMSDASIASIQKRGEAILKGELPASLNPTPKTQLPSQGSGTETRSQV